MQLTAHVEYDDDSTSRVIVDSWPRLLLVDDYFLRSPYVQFTEWPMMQITVENGSARYRFLRRESQYITLWEGLD